MLYLLSLTKFPRFTHGYRRSLVICAHTPDEARAHANATAGKEGQVWRDPDLATVEELNPLGRVAIICTSETGT